MRRVAVLYDRDCGFCRWSADRIRRWARGDVELVAIQDQRGQELLRDVAAGSRLDSMYAVTPDGRVWPAGAGVPHILRSLRGARVLAPVAVRFPDMTERLYRAVANRREAIGRSLGLNACEMPNPR